VPARKGASKGEELSAKLMMMYKTMADENNRLIADNKEARNKLKRAERSVKAARRRAEQAVKGPEELRVKLDKERVDMHFNLAVVYEKNGLYKDAEREYLKCLYIDPNDSGAHYNMGILYDDKLNSNDKALIHYNKFLALRPMGDTAERVRDWITKIELENRLGKEMR
jgi:tetratricopeptide (TPR) repeat protein